MPSPVRFWFMALGGMMSAGLFLAACTASLSRDREGTPLASDGRAIAEAQCSACHAVGATGDSPRTDAPPLRTVLDRYDAAALSDALIQGIKVGHPDMPQFELSPEGADSLVAYLQSIRTEPPR